MHKISEIMEKSSTAVWFYIGRDKEVRKTFIEELNASGYIFLNGEAVSDAGLGSIVSIHIDKKIANVSLLVWTNSFDNEGSKGRFYSKFYNTPKVDYEKYLRGEENFLMTTCNYKQIICK